MCICYIVTGHVQSHGWQENKQDSRNKLQRKQTRQHSKCSLKINFGQLMILVLAQHGLRLQLTQEVNKPLHNYTEVESQLPGVA